MIGRVTGLELLHAFEAAGLHQSASCLPFGDSVLQAIHRVMLTLLFQLERLRKAVKYANEFAKLVKDAAIADARSQLEVTVRSVISIVMATHARSGIYILDQGFS